MLKPNSWNTAYKHKFISLEESLSWQVLLYAVSSTSDNVNQAILTYFRLKSPQHLWVPYPLIIYKPINN